MHNPLVYDFGIPGYRPQWVDDPDEISKRHGRRLAALAGHMLCQTWLVWDLEHDEWYNNWPVLLDFDNERVEINHSKDEMSLTWNSIDPSRAIELDWELEWRPDPLPQLASLRGQRLHTVELLDPGIESGDGPIGLAFTFTAGHMTIFNAGDENGLAFDPPGPGRRHRV